MVNVKVKRKQNAIIEIEEMRGRRVIRRRQRDEVSDAFTVLDMLANATPEQIDAYIDAQVRDVASARELLKKLTKVVVLLVKLNH